MFKCMICDSKLRSLTIHINTCRCSGIYCRRHLHEHNCPYDYHELYRNQVEKILVPVIAEKVVKL